ncbi:uncharacterized protein LOC117899297 [Drosophila subobscura]|uniref:uncharacterized protein LOC117899297 n=1 Tax=Drosophila subobscura TaxID=7241 RepID=UPI00155AAA4E|nr:uncharacterized protein LOC117899297 [Drosophila subobscura]
MNKVSICQPNGNFRPVLPTTLCPNPLKAVVEEIPDPSCPHKMYRVGYSPQHPPVFFEVYRSCYDVDTMTAHFSIHLVHNKRLVVPRPEQGFTSDRIFPAADAVSFQNRIINQRFVDIFGTQQTYMPQNELIFARGHLAPVGDFVFEKDIRLTSKYINVVAQFASINNQMDVQNSPGRQPRAL